MADKRKRKPKTRREDLSRPSTWRRQHGEFGPPSFDTDPDTGAIVTHHRAADTLDRMLSNGTILREMHQDPDTIGRQHAPDASNAPAVRQWRISDWYHVHQQHGRHDQQPAMHAILDQSEQ